MNSESRLPSWPAWTSRCCKEDYELGSQIDWSQGIPNPFNADNFRNDYVPTFRSLPGQLVSTLAEDRLMTDTCTLVLTDDEAAAIALQSDGPCGRRCPPSTRTARPTWPRPSCVAAARWSSASSPSPTEPR